MVKKLVHDKLAVESGELASWLVFDGSIKSRFIATTSGWNPNNNISGDGLPISVS